jgi:eukaryotic-like serine/threonine-protein kinase
MPQPNDSDLFARAQVLFAEVCDLPPHDREAALAVADRDTSRIVRELLAADSVHGADLERAPLSFLDAPPHSTRIPETIGPYRVLDRLGTGGMGAVYRARGGSPEREVAVKVVRSVAASSDTLRRFRNEAEVLARLDHPAIARVHEAGTADIGGHGAEPYFAMELVEGEPLNRYVRGHQLGRDAIVRLVCEVADAVHHAHERGIVHRDLKPANVLVTAAGRPKVLDFGLARAIADGVGDQSLESMHTRTGDVLGTLGTMSPEQLSGDSSQIDARTDVYALGVMCYEALCGTLPLDVASLPPHEAARVVREVDPPALGLRDRRLGGDLETVVMKALAKEPGRRYRTAAAFSADLLRVLADEPIDARRPSTWYQASKFARRNRGFVGGVVAVFVVLVGGVAVSSSLYFEKEKERSAAVDARNDADRALARAENAKSQADVARLQALDARAEAEHERDRARAALASEASARSEAEETRAIEREARERAERATRVQRAVFDEFVSIIAAPTPWTEGRDVLLIDAVDGAAERARKAFPDDPVLRGQFLSAFTELYTGLGDWERAREFAAESLALSQDARVPELQRVELEVNLASLDTQLGAPDAVERLLGLIARLDELGAPDITVLRAINDTTPELQLRGSMDEALALAERGLALAPGVRAEFPHASFTARKVLGDVYMRVGRTDESLEQLEIALAHAREDGLGIQTVLCLNSIGAAHFQARRFEEARDAMTEVVERMRTDYGTEHRFYLTQLANLATVETSLGELDRSVGRLEEVIALAEQLEGPTSRNLAMALSSLTEAQRRRGESLAAVEAGERSLDLLIEIFGESSLFVANQQILYGKALCDAERYGDAVDALERGIEWKVENLSPEHPSLPDDHLWLAQAALGARDFERAASAAETCSTRGRAVPRPIWGMVVVSDQCRAIAVALAGEPERGLELAREAQPFTRSHAGGGSWLQQRADFVVALCEALLATDATERDAALERAARSREEARAAEGGDRPARVARMAELEAAVRERIENS